MPAVDHRNPPDQHRNEYPDAFLPGFPGVFRCLLRDVQPQDPQGKAGGGNAVTAGKETRYVSALRTFGFPLGFGFHIGFGLDSGRVLPKPAAKCRSGDGSPVVRGCYSFS